MFDLPLAASDAGELAEMLQFISDWLAADNGPMAASLTGFIGSDAYNISQLRSDLDRFTFLLGGSDGQSLFQPGQQ
jgi:hypothetical protein